MEFSYTPYHSGEAVMVVVRGDGEVVGRLIFRSEAEWQDFQRQHFVSAVAA